MEAPGKFYLIGLGGVGMSALAQILLARGHRVAGSDRFWDQGVPVPALDVLRRAGAELHRQDGTGLSDSTDVVVVSTAVENDNADLRKARALGCRVVHRAELLAELAAGGKLVAVTGTSGKTTVTGMIGWVLTAAGWDPTVINGGAVVGWGNERQVGSVRMGRSPWWVVEADESDKSLMHFSPNWAVVTNVSVDHFSIGEAVELFWRFAERACDGVVLGPRALEVWPKNRLGEMRACVVAAAPFVSHKKNDRWLFTLNGRDVKSPGYGRHNAENAFVAAVTCRQLGVPLDDVVCALEAFPGIERRLQLVGMAKGVAVVDDYAHNAAKIRAAWTAVAERYQRVLGVWRPHGFAPLRKSLTELTEAFAGVCREDDRLWLLPVFYSGGTADRSVGSEDLAKRLSERGVRVQTAADFGVLRRQILEEARVGDAVLCMGARDPLLPVFVRQLVEALSA